MPTRAHRVVALAIDGVIFLDLAAQKNLFGHCGAPYYTFTLAGVCPGAVRSSTGIKVVASAGIAGIV